MEQAFLHGLVQGQVDDVVRLVACHWTETLGAAIGPSPGATAEAEPYPQLDEVADVVGDAAGAVADVVSSTAQATGSLAGGGLGGLVGGLVAGLLGGLLGALGR
ncbi:hypothetical protein J6590_014420 [Homalodisca vitripennis]|nr:hypothetical protein J6590_014420 [Homalodisca vitripennis]